MPVAGHELEDERASMEAWRLQRLVAAGWEYHRARRVAERLDIPISVAVDLVRNGCSQALALKILL